MQTSRSVYDKDPSLFVERDGAIEAILLQMYTYDVLPPLKVTRFPFLGRVYHSQTTMKDSTFESKAYGKRVNKVIAIEGRVQFDLLQVSKTGFQ